MGVSLVSDFARNSVLNSISGATPTPALPTRGRESRGQFNWLLVWVLLTHFGATGSDSSFTHNGVDEVARRPDGPVASARHQVLVVQIAPEKTKRPRIAPGPIVMSNPQCAGA